MVVDFSELFTLNESVDLSVDDLFNLHLKLYGCEQNAPTEAWGLLRVINPGHC